MATEAASARTARERRSASRPRGAREAMRVAKTVPKCSGGGELHTWQAMDGGGEKLAFG